MELQECTGPINKQAALGITKASGRDGEQTTYYDCPGLIHENFYEIQKRLYGGLFCKDLTGWVIGDLVVWGLYSIPKNYKLPHTTLTHSKWACKCNCGTWQIFRYKTIMKMKRGEKTAKCEKCIGGWAPA